MASPVTHEAGFRRWRFAVCKPVRSHGPEIVPASGGRRKHQMRGQGGATFRRGCQEQERYTLSTRLLIPYLSFGAECSSEGLGIKDTVGLAVTHAIEIPFQVIEASGPK